MKTLIFTLSLSMSAFAGDYIEQYLSSPSGFEQFHEHWKEVEQNDYLIRQQNNDREQEYKFKELNNRLEQSGRDSLGDY